MKTKQKGIKAERELLHKLQEADFAVARIAGSGLLAPCDLIAAKSNQVFAIECKTTKKQVKYIKKEQLNALIEFARKFKARPIIAVKFRKWFFVDPAKLRLKGKNLAITKAEAEKFNLNLLKDKK